MFAHLLMGQRAAEWLSFTSEHLSESKLQQYLGPLDGVAKV